MREILFRGKTSSGDWVYGDYAKSTRSMVSNKKPHKSWIIGGFTSNGGWITPLYRHPVDEDTVGQYIGLVDKNGTKIFEGDIIEISGERYRVYFVNKYSRFAVIKQGVIAGIINFNNSEVIGNIHDNPELMKGETYGK